MTKDLKFNYEMLYKSAVFALQETYRQYKKAINDCLKWSFIDDKGTFCALSGHEERQAKAVELWNEVLRIQSDLERIKQQMSEGSDAE